MNSTSPKNVPVDQHIADLRRLLKTQSQVMAYQRLCVVYLDVIEGKVLFRDTKPIREEIWADLRAISQELREISR